MTFPVSKALLPLLLSRECDSWRVCVSMWGSQTALLFNSLLFSRDFTQSPPPLSLHLYDFISPLQRDVFHSISLLQHFFDPPSFLRTFFLCPHICSIPSCHVCLRYAMYVFVVASDNIYVYGNMWPIQQCFEVTCFFKHVWISSVHCNLQFYLFIIFELVTGND